MCTIAAGCGPTEWQEDERGIHHHKAEGSWRAVEAVAPSEAWFASSEGQWSRVSWGPLNSNIASFFDAVQGASDSLDIPHYRGLVCTADAVIGTAIGSPARIRKGRFEQDGTIHSCATVWQDDHPNAFLDAIINLDDRHLVAMGDPIDSCLYVVVSGDGGDQWKRVPCATDTTPGVPRNLPGEAAFAASNGNLAAAGDTVWMLSGGGASRVYRSLDRGESWQVFPTPLQQGGQMTGGFSMDFANARYGIIWGGNWEKKEDRTGRGAITADGGETWNLVAEDHGMGYGSSVRHQPGSQGQHLVVVGVPGGIDVSDDGGQHWRHCSDSAFYAARFSADGSTLWLAGNGKWGRLDASVLGW